MPIPRTLLYHLTEWKNRFSVQDHGLLTARDARKKGRIWACEYKHLRQIAEHLCERDRYSFMLYAVVEIRTFRLEETPKKCGREGVYYFEQDISPRAIAVMLKAMMVDLQPAMPTDEEVKNIRRNHGRRSR